MDKEQKLRKRFQELEEEHDLAWDRMNQSRGEEAAEEDEYIHQIILEQNQIMVWYGLVRYGKIR